jgi:hypothetical protein
LTNICYDISHIGENVCGLCGTPKPGGRSPYHKACKRDLDALKKRLRRKQRGQFNEIAYRYGVICENAEWILEHRSEEVQKAIGLKGEDAVLAFHTRRRECTR